MSFARTGKANKGGKTTNVDLEEGTQNGVTATLSHISSTLTQIGGHISAISKYENQLGTQRDTLEARGLINSQMAACQDMYNDLNRDLEHLDDVIAESTVEGDQEAKEMSAAKLSRNLLKKQINDVYMNYQVILRSYKEKLNSATVKEKFEKRMDEEKKRAQQTATDQTPLLPDAIQQNYTEEIHTQQQIQKQNEVSAATVQYHNDLIQQRDKAITSISQGVQDINKIFKDLDHMVNQQGEQVDSIENNMMNYATNHQLASHELVKADNYQRKKGKWTCIILVALVIFLLIFLALLS